MSTYADMIDSTDTGTAVASLTFTADNGVRYLFTAWTDGDMWVVVGHYWESANGMVPSGWEVIDPAADCLPNVSSFASTVADMIGGA